jgi:hypothetical protein
MLLEIDLPFRSPLAATLWHCVLSGKRKLGRDDEPVQDGLESLPLNYSDGYWEDVTTVPLSKPMHDLAEIWREVRRRIRTEDALFALVMNKSYLPRKGYLEQPISTIEVKFRGAAAKEIKQNQEKECLRDPRFGGNFLLLRKGHEPEIWEPCLVSMIRDKACREDWFRDEMIKTGIIEIGRQIGKRWVKLNEDQWTRSGEVTVREAMPNFNERPVTCIVPMTIEPEEEEDEDEDSDSGIASSNDDANLKPDTSKKRKVRLRL